MPQDAIAMLDLDHQRVEALFRDYQSAGSDMAKKSDLAQVICMELTLHAMLEEELFYPAFAQASGDQGLVQHAQQEHQEAKDLIARIASAMPPDETLMMELQRSVMEHVQEERQNMFPKARSCGMDLDGLATRMESRKSELLATLHQEA